MRDRFAKNGPCAEYRSFEYRISAATFLPGLNRTPNIWDFVSDAIGGTGGFVDGNYLVRFQRELKSTKAAERRFLERVATTKYDNFARRIADAPWNRIITHKDQISRKTKDKRVQQFWAAADRRRTPIMNVIEFPARQARSYGTGWLIVDRPLAPLLNRASDLDPALAPYAYCVPTRNVVDWEFDEDYRLTALTILEPHGSDDKADDYRKCNVRVWTTQEFAVYRPVGVKDYEVQSEGENPLGEVPAVQIFDGNPGPGRGFGVTVMPTIAGFERDVYNKTSEMRTLMRKCASFLGIPVKDLDVWLKKKIEIGEDIAVPYDSAAGKPEWISPDMAALVELANSIKADKEAAFELAQMTAISGYLETTSGFHQEAIFAEANTQISSFANQLEQGETAATRLDLRWHGETDEQQMREAFSVSYPTDFGIVDKDAVIARAQKRLDMDLGVQDAEECIFTMYVAEDPREDRTKLRERAKVAAQAHYQDKAATAQQDATTARARLRLAPRSAAAA